VTEPLPETEPVLPASPHALRAVLFSQWWRDLTFLHWEVDPAAVAPLLPAGTEPDLLHGRTYVGLVPFRMSGTSVAGSPAIPRLGDFLETNVRLYSVDRGGHRGVVFRSLDASRLPVVLTARRTLGLPYTWSAMTMRHDADVVRYRSRRRWPGPGAPRADVAVEVGGPVNEPDELERFLTNRWALHTRVAGRTWLLPNAHAPWRLRHARLLHLDEDLVRAAGLPAPEGAPASTLFAPGVPVHFGLPRPVPGT
jgi:uncharacterized protein YqjF (DUF2071 family)